MECLLPYLSMVTVPHIMVGLERMLDYRGIRLERFNNISFLLVCLQKRIDLSYVAKVYCMLL